THVFYERLRQSYENVKRYDAAIALVETQIERTANPELFMVEKARLLYLKGDETTARATWQSAVDRNPRAPGTYLMVYRSLLDVRLFDLAIDILEQGRDNIGARGLFQTDLAQLYSLTGLHGKAMDEYLGLLAVNQAQLSFVRSRLSEHMNGEEALRESIARARQAVATDPLNRSYRELLAWLYVEDGQFRSALDVYRAVDRLEKEEGRVLYAFAQVAADGAAYDVALEAYDEILNRYPDAQIAPDALRGLGLMQEKWAMTLGEQPVDSPGRDTLRTHFHDALETYQRFLIEYPRHPHFPDVLRRIGRLQQDVFHNYDEAEAVLAEVIGRYPSTDAANEAAFDMGRLAIMENRIGDARIRFSRLLTRLRTGELADRARYELALLHFYTGQFDVALGQTAAMQENTSTDVANDAIELKVLIIENRGPDSLDTPLTRFARARLVERQRDHEEALHLINDFLSDHGEHPLVDDARFMRAGLEARLGRYADAVQTYLEIPLMHPQTFLGDRSIFRAAMVTADRIGDTTRAAELLERVLTEYPGSLLLDDARTEMRRLRGEEV
ncbi:MAG: tetratricopeptide repeat protein, partial [Rhodothermales bacterium]|nr:tetratricopeptide repeat protein [Rhodothermales bacterium]